MSMKARLIVIVLGGMFGSLASAEVCETRVFLVDWRITTERSRALFVEAVEFCSIRVARLHPVVNDRLQAVMHAHSPRVSAAPTTRGRSRCLPDLHQKCKLRAVGRSRSSSVACRTEVDGMADQIAGQICENRSRTRSAMRQDAFGHPGAHGARLIGGLGMDTWRRSRTRARLAGGSWGVSPLRIESGVRLPQNPDRTRSFACPSRSTSTERGGKFDGRSADAAAVGHPRGARPHWHQVRMAVSRMRRVHRPGGRANVAFLFRPCLGARRSCSDDDRRPFIASCEACKRRGLDLDSCSRYCQSGQIMSATAPGWRASPSRATRHRPRDAGPTSAVCATYQRIRPAIHRRVVATHRLKGHTVHSLMNRFNNDEQAGSCSLLGSRSLSRHRYRAACSCKAAGRGRPRNRFRLARAGSAEAALPGEEGAATGPPRPNAFVRVGTDNLVTVICKHHEMGQGNTTGLASLVADELDADWSLVRTSTRRRMPAVQQPLVRGRCRGPAARPRSQFVSSVSRRRRYRAGHAVLAAAEAWRVPAREIRTSKEHAHARIGPAFHLRPRWRWPRAGNAARHSR